MLTSRLLRTARLRIAPTTTAATRPARMAAPATAKRAHSTACNHPNHQHCTPSSAPSASSSSSSSVSGVPQMSSSVFASASAAMTKLSTDMARRVAARTAPLRTISTSTTPIAAAPASAAAPPTYESAVSPDDLSDLLVNNKKWADAMVSADPQFFKRLENVQSPQYLWIGCSDSRVPANTIIGKLPGEVFVHRNVANCVVHTDLNLLSVLQFAVDVLKVRHVIVCGHYNCGGVKAAMSNQQFGLVDNWIRNVRDVYFHSEEVIDALPEEQRLDRLCEEHTREQTINVCRTQIVQNAWQRGQPVSINGFIYRLSDGKLNRLVDPITCVADTRLSAKFRVTPAGAAEAAQLVTPKWPLPPGATAKPTPAQPIFGHSQ